MIEFLPETLSFTLPNINFKLPTERRIGIAAE